MQELFRRDERAALEKKLIDNQLYSRTKSTWLRVMSESHSIRLSPVELFYLSVCIIDHIKGLTRDEAVAYCLDEVWYEYGEYLEEQFGLTGNTEIDKATALIMQTCAEWLIRSHDGQRISIATALKEQIVHHVDTSLSNNLDAEFRRGFRAVPEEEFAGGVLEYLDCEDLLSEELDELLDELVTAEDQPTEETHQGDKKNLEDFDFGDGIVLASNEKNRRYALCKLAMKAYGVKKLTKFQYELLNYIVGLPKGSKAISSLFDKIGKQGYGDLLSDEVPMHKGLNEKYELPKKEDAKA